MKSLPSLPIGDKKLWRLGALNQLAVEDWAVAFAHVSHSPDYLLRHCGPALQIDGEEDVPTGRRGLCIELGKRREPAPRVLEIVL